MFLLPPHTSLLSPPHSGTREHRGTDEKNFLRRGNCGGMDPKQKTE